MKKKGMHLVYISALSNYDILYGVDFFSELVHLPTLFAKKIMDTRRKENIKYRYSYLSTCSHFLHIFWRVQERIIIVLPKILKGLTLSPKGGGDKLTMPNT